MNVVVVGCGKTGTAVVASLYAEDHKLVVVDTDPAALEEICGTFDLMSLQGSGTDIETLREAGAASCQLLIAATASDEVNMLACFLAKKIGAEHTIARIRNPQYNENGLGFLCQQLDLSEHINPDKMAAKEIGNILQFPSAVNIESFSGRFELMEIVVREDSPFKDNTLLDIRRKYKEDFLVCAVQREGVTYIPNGLFKLQQGDKIAFTAAQEEAKKLLRELGVLQKSARRVMIIGAGKVSYYLCRMLADAGVDVTVIEVNQEICPEFAKKIDDSHVTVINDDGAKQDVLAAEGIDRMDAFVSLTGSDEENILLAVFAKSQDVHTVIAKVNRPEFALMAEKLGLECIISPNRIVTGKIAKYARALSTGEGSNLSAVYKILDGNAEALEFKVKPDFAYLGVAFKVLKLKKGILIGGIIRGRRMIVPSGNDEIMAGDRVVVISSGYRLGDLSEIVEDY